MEQKNNVVIGGKLLSKESVLRVIRDASEYNYAITKLLILNELGLKEDDKFLLKVLTKLLKQMREERLIDLVWTYNANKDTKFTGRGYVLYEGYQI